MIRVQRPHRRVDPWRQRVDQILDEQLVLGTRALVRGDPQIPPALVEFGVDEERRFFLPVVDQAVGGLRRAKPVVIDLLVLDRRFQRLTGRRLRIASVEEPLAVLRPRQAAELDPTDHVGQFLAAGEFSNPDRRPIGASLGLSVGQVLRIRRRHPRRQLGRSIRPQRVRIDDDRFRTGQRFASKHHRLLLEAFVAVVEPMTSFVERHRHLRVVPQLADSRLERVAKRKRVQVLEGDGVLRCDPLLHCRRVEVLHPAVGIGDLRAVIGVDDIAFAWRRVCDRRRLRQRRRGDSEEGAHDDQFLHREYSTGPLHIAFQYEIAILCMAYPIQRGVGTRG